MSRRIEWARQTAHDLRRLDELGQRRVISAVLRLAKTGQGDIKKLEGAGDEWRLRVGDLRVRFAYDPDDGALIVPHVLPRGRACR